MAARRPPNRPPGFWNVERNQREFMESLGKKMGYKTMEDWYKLTSRQIREHGGIGLLNKFRHSPTKILFKLFPGHSWNLQNFGTVPTGHWNSLDNCRVYVERLGKNLGYKSMEDWYRVTVKDFSKKGLSLLSRFGNSPSKLLMGIYPEHEWSLTRFINVPGGHWRDVGNQRAFMDKLSAHLGLKGMEDWYKVTIREIIDAGGVTLVDLYHNSPAKILQAVYPEHPWEIWRFHRVNKFLGKELNVGEFIKWLSEKLHIRDLSDWYRVSGAELVSVVSRSVFLSRSLEDMLQSVYPSHPWDSNKLRDKKSAKSSQRRLAVLVSQLFPGSEVREGVRHEDLMRENGMTMELDIYLPKERLAFEYQGRCHYDNIYAVGDQRKLRERDQLKKEMCSEKGITLIEVPYWWDFSSSSLTATIRKHRSDLLP